MPNQQDEFSKKITELNDAANEVRFNFFRARHNECSLTRIRGLLGKFVESVRDDLESFKEEDHRWDENLHLQIGDHLAKILIRKGIREGLTSAHTKFAKELDPENPISIEDARSAFTTPKLLSVALRNNQNQHRNPEESNDHYTLMKPRSRGKGGPSGLFRPREE